MLLPDSKQLMRMSSRGYFNFLRIAGARSFSLQGVMLFLALRCNLDCSFCSIGSGAFIDWRNSQADMETDRALDVIDQISDIQALRPKLRFYGGEPLLHPDFHYIVKHARKRRVKWSITSNGVFVKDQIDSFINTGCSDLTLSLDGPAEAHEKIRGASGIFSRIKEGIMELTKKKRGDGIPKISVNCVICRENQNVLKDFLAELSEWGVSSVSLQHTGGRFSEVSQDVDLDSLDETLTSIRTQSDRYPFPVIISPDLEKERLRAYYKNPDYLFGRKCILPWLALLVLPNGDSMICFENVGSLRQDSLKAVWNSPTANAFRKRIHNQSLPDYCSRCCHRQY